MQVPFRQAILRMRLRRAAQIFAGHGWAVTPGGYFNGKRMACDRPTCWATSCHPLLPDWETPTDLGRWWQDKPHSVLLPTGRNFDAIEVPVLVGSHVKTTCGPIIITPSDRWIFLVRSGSWLRPELAERFDIVHHEIGSWIPAPPTVLPEGLVRWHISPQQVGWHMPNPADVQSALVSALVALDASFLDRPVSAPPARTFGATSTMEAALRRAG